MDKKREKVYVKGAWPSVLHFHDEFGVAPAGLGDELEVRALLAHHAVLQDDDQVAVLHRSKSGKGTGKTEMDV